MNQDSTNTKKQGSRGVRGVLIGMVVTLFAGIGMTAWAQPSAPEGDGRFGRGMHHRMHGGGPGMMFGGSPERMGRMIDHMLDGLNASDAQRSQIKQIAAQAAADMKAQRAAGFELRQRGLQIFTAPTIDARAAEQVRAQMLQQHDQTSRRAMQAMIDVANVLTPEQRAQIGKRMNDRMSRMQERMQRRDERGATPR